MGSGSNHEIQVISSPTPEQQDSVLQALIAFNSKIVGPSGKKEMTFHIKDEQGQLLAGANGYNHWNYFFIAHLWVSDKLRGQGVGSRLMKKIETEAVSLGCSHLWLDTFSFQAAKFYEKLGYARVGQLEDYPKGHQRFFYSKELGKQGEASAKEAPP